MNTQSGVASRPSRADIDMAAEASRFLVQHLPADRQAIRINVVDEKDGTSTIEIPTAAMRLLVDVLSLMARGASATIFPIHAELSTQEAADLLNVSRPHLVKLLEANEIVHHKTGTHRRVRIEDLIDYMTKVGMRRKAALDELASHAQGQNLDY